MEVTIMAKGKQAEKKKGRSVQDLMGIKTFTKYGLANEQGRVVILPRFAHQYVGAVGCEH